MINAIFGHFAPWASPRDFMDEFYIFYTDGRSRRKKSYEPLTESEICFIMEAMRRNRTITTYAGILYLCTNTQLQVDMAVQERERKRNRFIGYHHKKKRSGSNGKKKGTSHAGRNQLSKNG